MRLFFEMGDKCARPVESGRVVVDSEEQEEPVSRSSGIGVHQRRVIVSTPFVKAKQYGPVAVHDLPKVIMSWIRLLVAEERLVPLEAARNAVHANDRPRTFHCCKSTSLFSVGWGSSLWKSAAAV